MWLHGAEKLQWSLEEAEVDAERAGCFAEQQLRLGLVVDGATQVSSASKDPCERTPIANERAQIEVRGGSTSQARFLKPGKYSHLAGHAVLLSDN